MYQRIEKLYSGEGKMSMINTDGSSKISVDKSAATSSVGSSGQEGTQSTSEGASIVNHVEISQEALEKQIEDLEKRIESIEKKILALTKKASADEQAQKQLESKQLELATLQAQLAALESQSIESR